MAPNVVQFADRFNTLSYFVASSILSEERLKDRARLFSRFIRIAEVCPVGVCVCV